MIKHGLLGNTGFTLKTIAAILIIFLPVLLPAQIELEVKKDPPEIYLEDVFYNKEVHSSNFYDLHLDSRGFLWIATVYGLSLYDGYEFHTYLSDLSDSTSLPDDRINTIFEDHSGEMWISTLRGLSRYNRARDDFTSYFPDPGNPNSPDNLILYVREDSKGIFWVTTAGGLFSFSENEFQDYKQDSLLPITEFRPAGNLLSETGFKEDKHGNLWFTAIKGGLKRYDPGQNKFYHYDVDPDDESKLQTEASIGVNVDKYDSVWVSTNGGGLYKMLDKEKGIFRHYSHDPDNPNSILSDALAEIYLGDDGNLWIMGRSGFSMYNYESDDFKNYKVPFDPAPYDYDNYLFQMIPDGSGNIWISSWEGVYRYEKGSGSIDYFFSDLFYGDVTTAVVSGQDGITWISTNTNIIKIDPQYKPFRHTYPEPENPFSPINDIYAIYKDSMDRFLIGTSGSGLYFHDPGSGSQEFYLYQNDPDDNNSITGNNINVIYEDKENTIWIGTSYGLNKLHWPDIIKPGKKPAITFTEYLHNDSIPTSIIGNQVEDILESSTGDLWVSTYRSGVDILNRETGEFRHILKDPEDFQEGNYEFNHYPTVLHEDRQGYMWIGTYNGGLFRYTVEDSSMVSYRNIPGDLTSLSDNCIRHIAEDKWGRLWLGTLKGLNLFEPETETFILFDKSKGFPGEMLKGLLVDEHGNLWISYDGGISKLVLTDDDDCLENPLFYNFNEDDGIQTNTFHRWSYFKSPEGEMHFGGGYGFTSFHPDSIRMNTDIPPVYITSFSKNDRQTLFDRPVYEMDEVTLKFKEKIFSFEFMVLNYSSSNKNQYAYMLEGFDDDWVYCGTEREARYTNISPGKYIFRVKGSNNDGIWNEEGASIRLRVKPPWYRTLLAYMVYVIALSLLVLGYVRRKTYLLKKENEILERKVKERTSVIEEQKEEIMAANSELEEQKEEVMATNSQLEEQKEELEQQTEELIQQKEELQITLDRLKETQEQLIQSEKLAALGGLVAGVAHEINTPVGISVTAASNLVEETKVMADKYKTNKISKADFKEYLTTANQSAKLILANMERTAEMVQSFKQISADQSTGEKRRVVLRTYVEDILRSLYPKLKGRRIAMVLDIDPNLEVESYPGAISQIFTNLIINSLVHGYEEKEKGEITIQSEIQEGKLIIQYSDSGKGISADNLKRIFEPFFTTNKKAGTGLGLHIVYNLVTQKLDGTVTCASKPGEGVEFKIIIPV